MSELAIPRHHRPAFEFLGSLPEEDVRRIAQGLEALDPRAAFGQLVEALRSFPELADAKVSPEQLANALLGLSVQSHFYGIKPNSLASDIAGSGDLSLDGEQRSRLQSALEDILAAPAVSLTAAAGDVMREAERPFHAARILTDIRPVFGSDVAESPVGAGLASTLKITYWTPEGTLQSVYFTLDREDLIALGQVVGRAIEKEDSVRRWMAPLNVTWYDPSQED